MADKSKLLFEEETYKIIGICMKVHRRLGPGFLESVYKEVLEKEFIAQGVPFEKEKKLKLYYNKVPLKKFFRADFICYKEIILETKAASFLHNNTKAQVINYLKSTYKPVGLLVNFGEKSLNWKRFINTK